jgi:hypothetical protein
MGEIRLGDIIDDFCVKCKRVMNHAVVSMVAGEPAKVRCRTCHNDHDYRHEQPPPAKTDSRKQALFNEVLSKVAPAAPVGELSADSAEPVDPEMDESLDEAALDETPLYDAPPEEEPPEPPAGEEPPPPKKAKAAVKKSPAKQKVKAKAKGQK